MSRALYSVLLGVALLVQGAAPAFAQVSGSPCPGISRRLVAYDHEQITVANSAIGFTAAKLVDSVSKQGAVAARVYVTTAQISVTDYTGGTPTTTDGDFFDAGNGFWACGAAVAATKMIRTTATSATATVTYFRLD